MIIRRIEVEEGFLDGLDLEFLPGLNVLIGPRGVGKTSVIELLRFSMAVSGFTAESDREARKHALSVLRAGRVTTTIDLGGERITVSRTAEETAPRRSPVVAFDQPTILSQREIELLGRDAVGRLRLVDSFRPGRDAVDSEEEALRASVASLTQELRSLAAEVDAVRTQLEDLKEVPGQLEEALRAEAAIRDRTVGAQEEQERLDALGVTMAQRGVQVAVIERSVESVSRWQERLQHLISSEPVLEEWPDTTTDQLSEVRERLSRARTSASDALSQVQRALEILTAASEEATAHRLAAQDEARSLRRRLEETQRGAGEATKRVADLREMAGQLEALSALLEAKLSQLEAAHEKRRETLDQLDSLRGKRFEERSAIVGMLNAELGPEIEVALERFGLHGEYASAIAASLRGSGLHYNTLAPLLASRLSPRELAEAVESSDVDTIAELGDIARDRAERAVTHMRSHGTHHFLTAPVEDAVTLSLLDGGEYKRSEDLSTGQRCTVILPILLSHRDQILVIDQPEDHLDNAFIVDTVVASLRKLGSTSQVILSTHNANIPVLGETQQVTLLGSDGERGFKRLSGPLDDERVVQAITDVMEGGHEAFELRAAFYKSKLSPERT